MFGLGGLEILVILLVGVMVLGPERLAKVMRGFTKITSEFRRVSTELQRTLNTEINLEEFNRKQELEDKKKPKKKTSSGGKKKTVKSTAQAKEETSAAPAGNNPEPPQEPAVEAPAPEQAAVEETTPENGDKA